MTERVALGCAFFGTHKNQARRPVEFGDLRNDALQLKMNISHVAASRPRGVESCAFSREHVSHVTTDEARPTPYAWKHALKDRIWSDEGPGTLQASRLLEVLLDHADADGRAWPGIQSLLRKTKIKSERTLQKALKELVRGGWLRIVRQTWTALTHIQTAAGKRAPRRGDAGQATNLYIVLDGQGRENNAKVPHRPGLARISKNTSNTDKTPPQKNRGGPLQKDRGEPPANLQPDLDPRGNLSKEERAERASRVDENTHRVSKNSKRRFEFSEAWDVIVETHAEKTTAAYGLPPLPPDLKQDQREALAGLLDGAAVDLRAKLHARTGLERELADVRRELSTRVMHLYFKRDNEHLRRVKHALRDLPREFHARLTEAMQGLLRESHDAEKPRRPLIEQPQDKTTSADKPAKIALEKHISKPKEHVASADKPIENVAQETPKQASSPASLEVAREARRLLEALGASSSQQELFRSSRDLAPMSTERKQVEPAPNAAQKDTEPKCFEVQLFEDKPSQDVPAEPRIERPFGRTGAPRWGSIGPRPSKVRRGRKLVPNEADSNEELGDRSSSNE